MKFSNGPVLMQAQHLFPLIMAVQFTPTHITQTYYHLTEQPSFKAKTHQECYILTLKRGEKSPQVSHHHYPLSTIITSLRRGPHNWARRLCLPLAQLSSPVHPLFPFFFFGIRSNLQSDAIKHFSLKKKKS